MENLNCSICYERYTEAGPRDPRVCPCGHTFCLSCLERLVNPYCPACRQFVPIGAGAVSNLPRNLSIVSMLAMPYDAGLNFGFLPEITEMNADQLIELQETVKRRLHEEKSKSIQADIDAVCHDIRETKSTIENGEARILELRNLLLEEESRVESAKIKLAEIEAWYQTLEEQQRKHQEEIMPITAVTLPAPELQELQEVAEEQQVVDNVQNNDLQAGDNNTLLRPHGSVTADRDRDRRRQDRAVDLRIRPRPRQVLPEPAPRRLLASSGEQVSGLFQGSSSGIVNLMSTCGSVTDVTLSASRSFSYHSPRRNENPTSNIRPLHYQRSAEAEDISLHRRDRDEHSLEGAEDDQQPLVRTARARDEEEYRSAQFVPWR